MAIVLAAAPVVFLLVAAAALAIWATDGRPVFYVQDRVGLRGRTFRIVKLRTMRRDGWRGPISATLCDDPRITLVGGVLRRYRVDELPQFVNVLRGEMSLIGPRPEQPALVEQYRALLPGFEERHLVKPGITGLAQVMYGYASTVEETRKKVRYDRFYVRHCSLALDWMIVAKTIRTLLWPLRVR